MTPAATLATVPTSTPVTPSKLASTSCGSSRPKRLHHPLAQVRDREDSAEVCSIGIGLVTSLCEEGLARGAPGPHFCSLNRLQKNA